VTKRFLAWLVAGLCLVGQVSGQSPAARDLTARLEKKTFFLRGFPEDLRISYDAQGNPVMPFEQGSWSYAQIYIERAIFGESKIEISGKRVGQAYDNGWREKRTAEEQVLVIIVDPATLTSEQAEKIFDAVFIPEKSVTKVIVHEWIKRDSSGAPLVNEATRVWRVGDLVQPPRPLESKTPAATEVRPKAGAVKFQGTVLLRVVVSEQGDVLAVGIRKPLGMGLDEKAQRSVREWRFAPATKNGRPVPVEMNIEVHFNLP
jgi:TonB family protein